MPKFNIPVQWRKTKFYEFNYPISNVSATQGTKSIQLDLKKYLTGDTDFLARMFVRIHGTLVKGGATAGAATGVDNPRGLLVSANLSTAPLYSNTLPINSVSQRGFDVDAGVNSDNDVFGSGAITDATGSVTVDQIYEIRFKQSEGRIVEGVGYDLALGRYTGLTLTLLFGGHDRLFTGGGITWDMTGLTVSLHADIDVAVTPRYIHAVEMFENNYPISASTTDFKVDNLPGGFVYTDLYILTEEANVMSNGILNNIALSNGAQVWLSKGEGNAEQLRRSGLSQAGRVQQPFQGSAAAQGNGQYLLPLHDGMFTKGVDCRNSPPLLSLDVTAGAATNIRIVGRRIIPGGIYVRPKAAKKAA